MADLVTFEQIREVLRAPVPSWEDPLRVVRSVSAFAAKDGFGPLGQELTLRLLEHRQALPSLEPAVDSLARSFGLFPYIAEPDQLSLADMIAYEIHRSELIADKKAIIFHREQAAVFHALLRGENVILSAPTSFGKSLIIDTLMASGRYKNVILILPTLALVDETRRRLRRFGDTHKVITHGSQALTERNVFVLTQERLLERLPELPIDLFVIDEFYKLSPDLEGEEDDGRTLLLNHAFYLLRKVGAQFYMLGPNIRAIPVGAEERLAARFIVSNYSTVVSEVTHVPAGESDEARLLALAQTITEPTIVYCRSPKRASDVALLLSSAIAESADALADAASWVEQEFHPDWSFPKALRKGIGVHHGQIPRSLGQFVVRKFNEGQLRFLVCTSTLIEGVNTCAKNVILFDNAVGRRQLDFFTFNNIKGRSGRMFRHFVGRVFLFHPAPAAELPAVDLPILTQPETTPPSLLIHLDDEDLSDRSRERLEPYREQDILSPSILKANVGIDLDIQIELARRLHEQATSYHDVLAWSGHPSYEQLGGIVALLREFPLGGHSSNLSDSATPAVIEKFRRKVPLSKIIVDQIKYSNGDADRAVLDILRFMRNYLTFAFPKGLRALDRIQRAVFARLGRAAGNYETYCRRAENAFLPGAVYSLDEFGIPLPLAMKVAASFPRSDDLDDALNALRRLRTGRRKLSEFEVTLLRNAQEGL